MNVASLGYVGLESSDPGTWDAMLTDVFGLARRPRSSRGDRAYRLDAYRQRIVVQEAKREALAYVGWEIADRNALSDVAGRIRASGLEVHVADEQLRRQRCVQELLWLRGPDGVRVELFCGPEQDPQPFLPGHGHGFKTGDQGMGHVVLVAQDPDATSKWYQQALGFKESDRIEWSEVRAVFLHCNPRHHSLAIINACFGLVPGAIHHLMLEARSLDDVGRAYDLVSERKLPLALTLGRHSNCGTISFYLAAPTCWIEYGFGSVEIDDANWVSRRYDTPKIWGHLGSEAGRSGAT